MEDYAFISCGEKFTASQILTASKDVIHGWKQYCANIQPLEIDTEKQAIPICEMDESADGRYIGDEAVNANTLQNPQNQDSYSHSYESTTHSVNNLKVETLEALRQFGLIMAVFMMVASIYILLISLEAGANRVRRTYRSRFGSGDEEESRTGGDLTARVGWTSSFKRYKN